MRGPSLALPPSEMPALEGDATTTLATTGVTRYHFHKCSSSKKPPVLLVHGVSATMDVWRELGGDLESAGRTVLYYDLTGRGYSEDTGEVQTMPYLVTQVEELFAAVGIVLETDRSVQSPAHPTFFHAALLGRSLLACLTPLSTFPLQRGHHWMEPRQCHCSRIHAQAPNSGS